MQNTNINELSSSRDDHDDENHENYTNEQTSDDPKHNKEKDEKVNENCSENLSITVENMGASSKNIVFDLKGDVYPNVSNKAITVFFLNSLKFLIKRRPPHENLNKQANAISWVEYSFGQGPNMFDADSDRNSFILLVMTIVLVMLLITAGWIICVFLTPSLFNMFHRPSLLLIILTSVGLTMVYFIMMCIPSAAGPPCIYFMLILTVFFMCLMSALVTCSYSTLILFHSFIATSAIVMVCMILACTSFDFTSFWLYFVVISVGFSVVVLCVYLGMMITGTYLKTAHVIILAILVTLQAVGLVMELQMILGGKSIEMETSECGMGAYILYTSILSIFLNLVQLLGITDE